MRYAVASLRRRPGFAATCVLTIGLGLAASVTVFAFVESVYVRALPVPNADRLVRVYVGGPDVGDGRLGYPAYRLLRERARSFDAVAAHYSTAPLYVSGNGEPAEIQARRCRRSTSRCSACGRGSAASSPPPRTRCRTVTPWR